VTERLRDRGRSVVLLDGDELREVLGAVAAKRGKLAAARA